MNLSTIVLGAAALLGVAACGGADADQVRSLPAESAPPSAPRVRPPTTSVAPPTTSAAPSTTSAAPSTTSAAPSTTSVPRPTATIDQLVGTPDARVHVRCVGQGDTTVVLIAGFGGDMTGWPDVESAVSAHARVCSYDRRGTGTSDPAGAVATFATQASELHALLDTVGEPGPYVVVGHSFGGAEAVTFASKFADEVVGLVLVDASPTTWPAAVCAVPDDGSGGAAMLRATCSVDFPPAGNSEHLDVHTAFAEVARITSLGSLPMAVITATDRDLPADLAAPEQARLTSTWDDGQHAWASLSTAAHLVQVDHTGHHIEIERPGVVIDEITRLLP